MKKKILCDCFLTLIFHPSCKVHALNTSTANVRNLFDLPTEPMVLESLQFEPSVTGYGLRYGRVTWIWSRIFESLHLEPSVNVYGHRYGCFAWMWSQIWSRRLETNNFCSKKYYYYGHGRYLR